MTLKKEGYLPRIIDRKIKRYLNIFGAISIEGPKWCGKTWTALTHANSVRFIMNPSASVNYRELARNEPALLLEGEEPVLIDEWQEVPSLWNAVRFAVDQGQKQGRFLLTGSTKPLRDDALHSGAGRMARVRMRPMTLFESGISTGKVSLSEILEGEKMQTSINEIPLKKLISVTCRGGWPANLDIEETESTEIPRQYIETLTRVDMSQIDDVRRDPARIKRLLRSFARNNASIVSNATLRKDLLEDHEELSPNTISAYISALSRLYVIEEIPAWNPEIRSRTRIRTSPKRVFVDPSLAVAALNIGPENLLLDLNTFGFMFENLCIRDLLCYAEAVDGEVYHYHDDNDLEVDVVIETKGGKWSAFEIKLGEHRIGEAVSSLLKLLEKVESKGGRPPTALCVITGGGLSWQREDGIRVIPINALAP
jgi:predicted AAA+ superfamily ATPase